MDIGGYSATGPRAANEDGFYYRDFSDVDSFANGVIAFVLVSDGMGGYECGDVASKLVVASASSYISQLLDMATGNLVELDPAVALCEIARNAHDAILAEAQSRGHASMGATYVAAFVGKNHAWIGHVGDSRAYLFHKDAVTQITEDHSRVGRMLSQGVITEKEAQKHPERNKIERALGFSDSTPDINEVDVEPNDSLLLCSDGAYTVLDSKELQSCVLTAQDSSAAATQIVNYALKKGTDDNTTAVVLCNRSKASGTVRTGSPMPAIAIVILLIGALLGVMAMMLIRNTPAEGNVEVNAPTQNEPLTTTNSAEPNDAEAENGITIPTAAELKYVDQDGLAQLFSYEPFGVPTALMLKEGSTIQTTGDANPYGRSDKAYLTLADSYKESLVNDYARYCDGAPSFDSNIAALVDADEYLQFFEEMYDMGIEPTNLDELVDHLVIEDLNEAQTSSWGDHV